MATYTKIGRIRPDYADVWDSARSYTALEMVKSEDSYHAYIAKQDVPAGTPLTDADYWGVVLDVSDVIAESAAAAERANAAADNADAAREGIQGDLDGMYDALRGRGSAIVCAAEGETVSLTDSSDDAVRGLRIFGKTEQVTTTGAQLIPFPYYEMSVERSGITWTVNPDGSIVANGTATSASWIVIGSGNEWANEMIQAMGQVVTSNGKTFADCNYNNNNKLLSVNIDSGVTVNNKVFYPMINAGETALPYEPYTGGAPSPSPDYPQELVSVGDSGSVGVTLCGKNLLNPDARNSAGNGSVHWHRTDGGILLQGGKTYTFSVHDVTEPPNGLYIYKLDGENIFWVYNKAEITFTLADDMPIYIYALWNQGQAQTVYENARGQLELGSVATAYEPCKPAQTLSALTPNGLPGIPVTSGGNYTDADGQMWVCDEVDFERGVYVKRINELALNGNENINSQWYPLVVVSLPSGKPANYICAVMCNYYKAIRVSNAAGTGVVFENVDTHGFESATSFADFIAQKYAEGNPVKVAYVLVTPIETSLTAEEIAAYRALRTNKPNTTVFNDAGAHMAVEYNADTKLYIDNKFAELAAALVNGNA